MHIVILGAGLMARGALHDYLHCDDVSSVHLCDRDPQALAQLAAWADDSRVRTRLLDATDEDAVASILEGADGLFSAIDYRFNPIFTRIAIETGTNMVDLGGNNDVVATQRTMDSQAAAAGVSVVPDCGLAPGFASMLVAWGLKRFDWADSVHIRVGGLPLHPQHPLMYERLFSVEGLINEYVEPPILLSDGQIVTAEPLQDVEHLSFPDPVGELEAFNTSGGVSTLPETYGARLRNLDYKTLRYPGHAHAMQWLYALGLFSSEPIDVNGQSIVPRELTARAIVNNVPLAERDRTVMRVEFRGANDTHRLDVLDEHDEETGLTGMMRTTSFPAAIISQMQCRGEIGPGVRPQEQVVDPDRFVEAIARRGIEIRGI